MTNLEEKKALEQQESDARTNMIRKGSPERGWDGLIVRLLSEIGRGNTCGIPGN